jgi:RNA polymerase sigma-70 factor (ECF subfamily)
VLVIVRNINSHSEKILVLDLQQGSGVAFRKIFDCYQSRLISYTMAIVKTESTGKDIVQETFIRLWTHRKQLDPEQSLSGYLHTIARNLALNHLKRAAYDRELKQQVWKMIEKSQQRNSTEDMLFARECERLVSEAIDYLPPQRKLIFQLSRQKGMTHQEIGLKLGISKNTVKNQMVSALKEIRSYLNLHSDIAL